MKSKKIKAAIFLAAAISGFAGGTLACGPFFPNNLLDAGDRAVLQSPVADFQRELERMKLVAPSARALPLADGQKFYDQSTAAEMTDLAAALKREKISSELATVIMQSHLGERMKLNGFLAKRKEWEWQQRLAEENNKNGFSTTAPPGSKPDAAATNLPPLFPDIAVTPGLPREFADYFAGAVAWQEHEGWSADDAWGRLLQLPEAERHFKSTWATFMLAKNYADHAAETTNPCDCDLVLEDENKALNYYEQVRTLAAKGFADSLGLATTSLGDEAQIYLDRKDYERAIELYLKQFAAGDRSAVDSLRFAAARAVDETNSSPAQLKILALNPRTRRVITAYLISRNPYHDVSEATNDPGAKQFFDHTTAWLEAVESANVKDVESASKLALAAYQASQMDIAQRWINRAGDEPVAQWLQAKLFMRAGKIPEAAKLLTKVSRKFPQEFPGTNEPFSFAQSLHLNRIVEYDEFIPVGRQSLGELGVLHLARREYAESLDALLRSGYWIDAAYVAERVLTVDELKNYVDHNWPAAALKNEIQFDNPYEYRHGPIQVRLDIRYLLARRLARENRYAEARDYFPAEWRQPFDVFAAKIQAGQDEKLPGQQRAISTHAAARMMRTNGMELVGTELQPDWFVEGGNYGEGVTWQDRATNSTNERINIASADEISRAAAHGVEPDELWHYRSLSKRMIYQAADLAWAAAKSMPDNSDDTARFLCIAGTWLKKIDPPAADKFYKALVRRCRKTAIGDLADKTRWFPLLDENGNLEPWPPPRKFYGEKYIIRYGDTLVNVALDTGVTLQAIREANPGLNPVRLKIGQVIAIPEASGVNAAPEMPAAPH